MRAGTQVVMWLVLLLLVVPLLGGQPGAGASESGARILAGHTDVVWSVAFSPDGNLLASASEDASIRLWDIPTEATRRILRADGDGFRAVAFAPDGTLLASCSANTVQLWDTRTWTVVRVLNGHTGDVTAVAISPKGGLLASAAFDGTVRLWDLRSGELLRTLRGSTTNAVHSVAFSPDGRSLASGDEYATVTIWDVQTGTIRRLIIRKDTDRPSWFHSIGSVMAVAWSPDGTTVAGAGTTGSEDIGRDLKITLWDPTTGAVQKEIGTGKGQVLWSVALSPHGDFLAAGTWQTFDVRLWTARTVKPWQTLDVRLWGTRTVEPAQRYRGHSGFILALAFSPDGKMLASASADTTVRLWPVGARP